MKTMASAKNGIVQFNFNGSDNIGSYAKLGSMYTLVYMDSVSYKKAVSTARIKILVAIFFCIIAAVAVILAVTLSITRPIKIVDFSIHEIATGNADKYKFCNGFI